MYLEINGERLIPHNKLLKDAWFWKKDTGKLEIAAFGFWPSEK